MSRMRIVIVSPPPWCGVRFGRGCPELRTYTRCLFWGGAGVASGRPRPRGEVGRWLRDPESSSLLTYLLRARLMRPRCASGAQIRQYVPLRFSLGRVIRALATIIQQAASSAHQKSRPGSRGAPGGTRTARARSGCGANAPPKPTSSARAKHAAERRRSPAGLLAGGTSALGRALRPGVRSRSTALSGVGARPLLGDGVSTPRDAQGRSGLLPAARSEASTALGGAGGRSEATSAVVGSSSVHRPVKGNRVSSGSASFVEEPRQPAGDAQARPSSRR